jgi:acetyltransferase-like isoleucine patch superfamily enzyme
MAVTSKARETAPHDKEGADLAALEVSRAERTKLYYALRALGSPSLVWQVLSGRWQLRKCDVLAPTVRVRGRVRVEKYGGRIEVGERVRFEARTIPVEMVAWQGAMLSIGSGTFINYATSLSAHRLVSIGRDCMIGNYVVIMDSDYHELLDRSRLDEAAPVIIEDGVWIGLRATVLKGVRIGRGSVVGAGSLVTSDIPPDSLALGVPARVVRSLRP